MSSSSAPATNPIPVDPNKSILHGDVVKLVTVDRNMHQGRNVSGRKWKVRTQKRASTLIKTIVNNQVSTYETRLQLKRSKQNIKELQTELQNATRQEKLDKKEKKLQQDKQRAENEFKQAQLASQTLNANKVGRTLKAMSKKQLRQIKKTRLNPKTGVVEYVGAYTK